MNFGEEARLPGKIARRSFEACGVRPHVEFVLVLVRDSESEPCIEAEGWIELHYRQGYCRGLFLRKAENGPNDLRADAFPLHRGCYMNRTQENRIVILSLLNPTHICPINGDDADFLGLKPVGKAPLLANLVPAEQALNGPTHSFEV
jgi:hypothetical protein